MNAAVSIFLCLKAPVCFDWEAALASWAYGFCNHMGSSLFCVSCSVDAVMKFLIAF